MCPKSRKSGGAKAKASGGQVLDPDIIQPPVHPPADRPGRMTNQLDFILKRVIPSLFKHKDALPFKDPVNPVKLKLVNYYSFVKEPMDLRTIRERLKNKYYFNLEECLRDFSLLFANVLVYNKPDTPVVASANELESAFICNLVGIPDDEVEGNYVPSSIGSTPVESKEAQETGRGKREIKPVRRFSMDVKTMPSPAVRRDSSSSPSSKSSSSSSSGLSSSGSGSESESDGSDGDQKIREYVGKMDLKILGLQVKITELEGKKRRYEKNKQKKLQVLSKNKPNQKAKKDKKKKGRKRKVSVTTSNSDDKSVKAKKQPKMVTPAVPSTSTPVVSSNAARKGNSPAVKRAGIDQDREELKDMLNKMNPGDIVTLLGILHSDDIDVDTLEPSKLQAAIKFATSRLSKGTFASSPSPSPSPERVDQEEVGLPTSKEMEENPADAAGSNGRFYDSEDEELLETC